jgi:hypothetical protein
MYYYKNCGKDMGENVKEASSYDKFNENVTVDTPMLHGAKSEIFQPLILTKRR